MISGLALGAGLLGSDLPFLGCSCGGSDMKTGWPRWLKILTVVLVVLVLLIGAGLLGLNWYIRSQYLDSGGPLTPAMAGYDVRHYEIDVGVKPELQMIEGRTAVTVESVAPVDVFEIHLDDRLTVADIEVDGVASEFEHDDGLIRVVPTPAWGIGERHTVRITYGGKPKVALKAPWIDGFVWSETPSGAPWIGVTGQGDGGDNWWPCKDHPSDEPDEGLDIALTVPDDLVGLTNGRKVGERNNGDGTITTQWRVGYPINNYLVTLNIAPYVPIEESYRGIDGTLDETLIFWSLPEYVDEARVMWRQMPRILEVLGKRFGEYPFFDDKFWVAHAPYLGMEHQTIVAYGDQFEDNDYGFDGLLLHEVAHEWWGNKVTAKDWADFWLQEGFAVYSEALYVLDTLGEQRYLDYMADVREGIRNRTPIVQGDDLTSAKAYTGDIYPKGAWVLHMLRWMLGDDHFFEILWCFSNDEPFAYGFVETEDLMALVAEVSGRNDLDWFWQKYLFEAKPPRWSVSRESGPKHDRVHLSWDEPGFEMPLPVRVDGDVRRVEMSGGSALIEVAPGQQVEIDPEGWVLALGEH
jgi:aminopeptidase N